MKTRLIPLAALGLLALGWAGAGAQTATSPNLVMNPSLEGPVEPATGLPKDWYTFGKPAGSFQAKLDDSGRGEGKALRVQSDGDYGGVVTNLVPREPGKDYVVRGWIKLDHPTGTALLKIDFFDDKRSYIVSSLNNPSIKGSVGEWQYVSFVVRSEEVPANCATLALACVAMKNSAAFYDDVELLVRDPADPANLLKDGSLENASGDGLASWKVVQPKEGMVKMLRRTVPVKDGSFSMQLLGKAQWAVTETELIPIEAGKKYTLTAWARARKGKGNIRIGYVGPDGYMGQSTSANVETNQWTQLSVTTEFEKFPGATRINPGATIAGGGDVDLIFDSFVLKAE